MRYRTQAENIAASFEFRYGFSSEEKNWQQDETLNSAADV